MTWLALHLVIGLFWAELVHRTCLRLERQRGRRYRRPRSTYVVTIFAWPLIVVMALFAIGAGRKNT